MPISYPPGSPVGASDWWGTDKGSHTPQELRAFEGWLWQQGYDQTTMDSAALQTAYNAFVAWCNANGGGSILGPLLPPGSR
jgi:hypothetical protein